MQNSESKVALISGITGQDGAYLCHFLLTKGYVVHGIRRRTSLPNDIRLVSLGLSDASKNLFLHDADLTDAGSIIRLLNKIRPDEIYNLAAQSHVAVSFDVPEYTANSDALGTLRFLEAIVNLNLNGKTKFYQASTSELFGRVQEIPQTEKTPFYPRSPYAVAKLYAYWITVNYREAYDLFATNGILFNHESPLRGEDFVTRKITKGLCEVQLGLRECLILGNIDAKRDWGHAKDFVEMQWLMLQHDHPDDFVIATGRQETVRYFVEVAAHNLGMKITWRGSQENECGYDQNGRAVVRISSEFYRPTEVDTLVGDPTKAKNLLGWQPKYSLEDIIEEMVSFDLANLKSGASRVKI